MKLTMLRARELLAVSQMWLANGMKKDIPVAPAELEELCIAFLRGQPQPIRLTDAIGGVHAKAASNVGPLIDQFPPEAA